MGLVLVLAGNHQQFIGWLEMVYAKRARVGDPPRHVDRPDHLWGVDAEAVDAFHQVGTYWQNPAWGSEPYLQLHREGHAIGKAWAMSWELDWRKANRLRKPVTPEEVDAARAALAWVERELSDE